MAHVIDNNKFKCEVYLRDGRVSVVECDNEEKARELCGSIFLNGHARLMITDGVLEYYPLWMIVKVKMTGNFTTAWPQVWRGT